MRVVPVGAVYRTLPKSTAYAIMYNDFVQTYNFFVHGVTLCLSNSSPQECV